MGNKKSVQNGGEQVSQADWNRLNCEDTEDSLTWCHLLE